MTSRTTARRPLAAERLPPLRIKLPVPYYSQKFDFTCGPAALMMALKYFDPSWELNRSLELQLWRESTVIFMTSGIGGCGPEGIAAAGAARGLTVRVVLKRKDTPVVASVRQPKKRAVIRQCHKELMSRAARLGVEFQCADFDLREVEAVLTHGGLAIVLVSLYRLRGTKEPHWVLVTGFSRKYIYVHDPYHEEGEHPLAGRHLAIERAEFRRMKRYGTDVQKSMVIVAPKWLDQFLDHLA
ncbi:MAG: peptidase C39 family protein [Planctomycetota bacterium]